MHYIRKEAKLPWCVVCPAAPFLRHRLRGLQICVTTTLYRAFIDLFHPVASIPPSSPHHKRNFGAGELYVVPTLNSRAFRAAVCNVTKIVKAETCNVASIVPKKSSTAA